MTIKVLTVYKNCFDWSYTVEQASFIFRASNPQNFKFEIGTIGSPYGLFPGSLSFNLWIVESFLYDLHFLEMNYPFLNDTPKTTSLWTVKIVAFWCIKFPRIETSFLKRPQLLKYYVNSYLDLTDFLKEVFKWNWSTCQIRVLRHGIFC